MRPVLFLVFSFFWLSATAQKEGNIWYFGNFAGIDFNTVPPTNLTNGALNTIEGCATICNKRGGLLFYTDGTSIYNRNHSIMTNGSGLNGFTSSTQSAIIVANPDSANIYYVFTTSGSTTKGLYYTVVDTSLSSGLGAVRVKNIPLMPPQSSEKLNAIRHANGKDVWVMTRRRGGNSFYAYKVTASGVDTTPVISSVGSVMNDIGAGWLKFSPDGRKLVVADFLDGYVEMFDFNAQTGALSSSQRLISATNYYGVEFSASGRYLYLSTCTFSPANNYVYQYDLNAGNLSSIINSRKQICSTSAGAPGALQLAPDGRIYMAIYSGYRYLSVINFPERSDTACGFVLNGFDLSPKSSSWGLPSFNQSFFRKVPVNARFNCFGDSTQLVITDTMMIDSVKWYFGDGDFSEKLYKKFQIKHKYPGTGDYTGKIILYRSVMPYIDSGDFSLKINRYPDIIKSSDTIICRGRTAYLKVADTMNGKAIFTWSHGLPSKTNHSVIPNNTTSYVVVADGGCQQNDTDHITVFVRPVTGVSLRSDTTLCHGDSINLIPVGSGGDSSYILTWDNDLGIGPEKMVKPFATTTYIVTLSDYCTLVVPPQDSITVYVRPSLKVKLNSDTTICLGRSVMLKASGSGGDSTYIFKWDQGSGDSVTVSPDTSTLYKVVLNDGCTAKADTGQVKIYVRDSLQLLLTFTDTTICAGQTVLLAPKFSGGDSSYTLHWDDGTDTGTMKDLSPKITGTYRVILSDQCGSRNDTAFVNIYVRDTLHIGLFADTTICPGNTLFMEPLLEGGDSTYILQWETGLGTGTSKSVAPKDTVTYLLVLQDGCTVKADSHWVKVNVWPRLEVSAGRDTIICAGQTVILLASGKNAKPEGYTFKWEHSADTGAMQLISPLSGGYYVVSLSDKCLQNVSDTVAVGVEQLPSISFTLSDSSICLGEEISFVNLSSGPSSYAYIWSFGDGKTSGSANPQHSYKTTGTFDVSLKGRSLAGCTDSLIKAAYITVNKNPGARFFSKFPDSDYESKEVNLLNYSTEADFYDWDFGDSEKSTEKEPTHFYKDTGYYPITLIVSNQAGCYDTADYLFRVNDIYRFYIPSAFSPNQDGMNEYFRYEGRGYRTVKTRIFNRWGELVYSSDKPGEFWNGAVNSRLYDADAIYFYTFEVQDFRNRQHFYSGALTVIR